MGVHGNGNSKKRSTVSSRKLSRLKRADQKKKSKIVGEILDAEITTEAHLRKRRTSQRANITLSGKKKRKLGKTIKRLQKKKNAMDVEVDTPEASSRNIEMSNGDKMKEKTANPKSEELPTDITMTDS